MKLADATADWTGKTGKGICSINRIKKAVHPYSPLPRHPLTRRNGTKSVTHAPVKIYYFFHDASRCRCTQTIRADFRMRSSAKAVDWPTSQTRHRQPRGRQERAGRRRSERRPSRQPPPRPPGDRERVFPEIS